MNDLLANPAIQSGPIPFFTALLVAGVLGFPGLQGGPRIAGLAVLAGFLVAYVAALGLPPPPPKSSGQKIAYIAILAVFTGLFLDCACRLWPLPPLALYGLAAARSWPHLPLITCP